MNRILVVCIAVTRSWLRSRAGVFFSFLFPLLLLVVFGAIFAGSGGGRPALQIQNNDLAADGTPTSLSTAFIQALNQSKTLDLKMIPPSSNPLDYAKSARSFFQASPRILIIPKGFHNDVLNATSKNTLSITYASTRDFLQKYGQYLPANQTEAMRQGLNFLNVTLLGMPDRNATLIFISEPADSGGPIVRGTIAGVANSFNYYLIGATPGITFTDQSTVTQKLSATAFFMPGIIGAFIMTNGVIALAATATEFKRRGIMKRLYTTPLSKPEWVLGNLLSQAFLAILLTGFILIMGWLLFQVTVTIDVYTVALLFTGAVLFSGIGMIIGGVFKDPEAASGVGNAIAFPMMFLSGTFFVIETTPQYMQAISRVLPLTYFTDGLRANMILQNTSATIFDLGILAALAAVLITVGSIVTQWKEK